MRYAIHQPSPCSLYGRDKSNHAAVVPSVANEKEPLHAIYTRACLGPIRSLVDSKHYQIRLFYKHVSVMYVKEDEIRRLGSPNRRFLDINSADELAKIRCLMGD
jgi:molybdopterin-guanine dinucleotide biosynthesis protein A